MASKRGLSGRALARQGNFHGAPLFVISFAGAAAGVNDTTFYVSNAPFRFRVVDFWGYMTGAGAASDTVKLVSGDGDVTDAVDLSSHGDTDRIITGELDDANNVVPQGGSLKITTASDASVQMFALCVRVD